MPDWRIIHIARHPCGWIDSQNRGHRENRFSSDDRKDWWRFDLLQATSPARRRGLSEASFRTMSDLERDAWSWVLWNEIAAEATEGLTNVITILYEDVCSSPIDQSRRIFSFAGLDWHPQSEAFVTRSVNTTATITASTEIHSRQRINGDAASRPKNCVSLNRSCGRAS